MSKAVTSINPVLTFEETPYNYVRTMASASEERAYEFETVSGVVEDGFDVFQYLVDTLGEPNLTQDEGDGFYAYTWVSDDPWFIVQASTNAYGNWRIGGTGSKLVPLAAISVTLRAHLRSRKRKAINTVVSNGSSLQLRRIGNVDSPLVRGNYVDEVLESYDHALSCLKSESPCGRIVVLDGPPGTGKTHLIRGIVSDYVDAKYVVVGANIMGELTGPNMMELLINLSHSDEQYGNGRRREGKKSEPIVLILEDGDAAISKRTSSGSRAEKLSDILNLGDGLLGDLMDMRILITTNAPRVDLDEAITRPGRMCKHIHTPELPAQRAKEVYKRLTGNETSLITKSKASLADVYRLAREDGWTGTKKKEPVEVGGYV